MGVGFVSPLFQVRPAQRCCAWACVSLITLVLLACEAASGAASSPDSAGLVGSSPERPTLPFKLWARSPKSPLKPRRRDLREPELRLMMGDDFDPRWMRTHAYHGPDPPEGPRQSVQKLVALAAREALPDDLTPAAREAVRAWLVRRSTCPVRYQWGDLGPYFWPRWVRRGHCASDGDSHATTTPAASAHLPLSDTPFPKSLSNAGVEQQTETPETEESDSDDYRDCDDDTCRSLAGDQPKNSTLPEVKRVSRTLAGLEQMNVSSSDVEGNSSLGVEPRNSTSLNEDLQPSVMASGITGLGQRNSSSLDQERNTTSGGKQRSFYSLESNWTSSRNASRGEGNGASGVVGEASGQRPCSWPPGMRCVPSAAKVLQLLRWHCRLRKSALSNSVWVQAADRKKRRRRRFRCQWLKVPYPVAEDCTCA